MLKTDHASVDNALDDVLKAAGVLDTRRCAIGVANLGTASLSSPKWYLYSGQIYSAAPYEIRARNTGLSLFIKTTVSVFGTSGVLSYDIEGTDYKVALMWQVPWNTLLYDIVFNVKLYNKNVPTNRDMFDQMSKYAGSKNSVGWMEKSEYGVDVRASLTDNNQAKFYVSVDATGYSNSIGPELHTDCDYNALWFGKYCWQECSPTGYCWVNKKCSRASDCVGPLNCYDKCKKT